MTRTIHALCCLTTITLAPACLDPTAGQPDPDLGSEPDDPGDGRDDGFFAGKADGACVEEDTPAGDGVLALVNDPSVSFEFLDAPLAQGGVGLDRRAAQGIVEGRPFADLQQLDAVPYVGIHACSALAHHACNVEQRCVAPLPLLSWNTEHFPLTPAAPGGVIDIVDELRPALVGLQEVEHSGAFGDVLDGLDGYSGILGEPGPFTRVGLLIDDHALEVLAVEHLFVDDGWAFPRPVLGVRVRPRRAATPMEITVLVLHLKALPDATSRSRRALAIEDLRQLVDERRAQGNGEIVILGDWNDELLDAPAVNVFTPLLDDTAFAKFLTFDAAESGEATLIPFNALLDHVMVTQEVLAVAPHLSTEILHLDMTWSPDYEQTVSDHRPVLSVFGLPQPW
ncbi:MAG: hypothetical protein K0V04_38690 [Deltaproteobacteria bacterium]|nr:hypothetical protein [Deltaproteobacteria bacterium]